MAKLPYFPPVSEDELRALYALHRDPDIRRLVLEVVRYRDVIKSVDEHYVSINKAWLDAIGGSSFGLQLLQTLVNRERERLRF